MSDDGDEITIQYPCDYPIKVIGTASEGFRDEVLGIFERLDASYSDVTERDSKEGTYRSLTVHLWATGEEQLATLFSALKESDAVRMVL